MLFDTILFDLDDTLHDRNKTLLRFIDIFITNFANELDKSSIESLKDIFVEIDCHGYKPRKEMFKELKSRIYWRIIPDVEDLLSFWNEEFPNCAVPVSGLYEVLDYFASKHIKMGIVTNGETLFQNTKIDKLSLRKYINTIIISEEVGIRKPDAAIFDVALNSIHSEKQKTLYVGDNPTTDIKGAVNAGLIPVWLSGNELWSDTYYVPRYIIKDITGLLNL